MAELLTDIAAVYKLFHALAHKRLTPQEACHRYRGLTANLHPRSTPYWQNASRPS